MRERKTPELVIDEKGLAWNTDDFFLDSHGVEAPLRERLEKLHENGFTPEQVSIDIEQRYAKYLERMASKGKP